MGQALARRICTLAVAALTATPTACAEKEQPAPEIETSSPGLDAGPHDSGPRDSGAPARAPRSCSAQACTDAAAPRRRDAGATGGVDPEFACVANTLMSIGDPGQSACAECICENALREALACDVSCWGLLNCARMRCESGMDIQCIVAQCADFLQAANRATALHQSVVDVCLDPCTGVLPL